VDIDLTVGGKVRFVFGDGEGPPPDGVVTDLDPPRLVAYTWGEDHLRWELRPDGAGTRLVLTQTFADRSGAASFAAGWQGCLEALDHVLAGTPVPPRSRRVAEHEAYVRSLGLDAGQAEGTVDGWRVRFERQLTVPAQAAWSALTGDADPVPGDPAPAPATTGAAPAGPVTAVDRARLLEYEGPAGLVRWELGEGTGHGARLTLTHTGAADPDASLRAWRDRVEDLAAALAATADR